MKRTHLDLFSGIGGFALACRWAGVQTIGFAEIEPYPCRVLAKNFPGVTNYGDIRNVPGHDTTGPVWLLTGGFPCQPFSVAGQQRGKGDDRYLWPEMAACIERARPAWVLAENVPGIIGMELDTVLFDLEALGYTAWPVVVPAVAVDAPHRRDRVWIVAHDDRSRRVGPRSDSAESNARPDRRHDTAGICADVAHANGHNGHGRGGNVQVGRFGFTESTPGDGDTSGNQWQPEPELGRVAHGIPRRVDRLRGLGEAIVPQVAYELICMMIAAEGQAWYATQTTTA